MNHPGTTLDQHSEISGSDKARTEEMTSMANLESTSIAVYGLRTEYLDEPLAIEVQQPRFSWKLLGDRPCAAQNAYRVVVASTRCMRTGMIWDSGWVESRRTFEVEYAGSPLRSRNKAYWQVTIRDDLGNEVSSDVASFEVGLLSQDDWHGEWIDAETETDRERRLRGGVSDSEPALLMRSEFHVSKPVASARMYATALGAYEAYINGSRAGQALLAPEISSADSHVYYQVHDVTDLVRPGANAMGLVVADGYYAARFFWSSAPRYAFGPGPRKVRAFVEISYQDGTSDIVATGTHWKQMASPVTESSLYDGERYDARLERPGWNCCGFDAADWQDVQCSPGARPPMRLVAQNSPAIQEIGIVPAVRSSWVNETTRVYDFGVNFAGLCRLKATGDAGDQLTVRFAEVLNPDGTLDVRNLRTAKATDRYVLKGGMVTEVWMPSFTYHGFRYASVSGKIVRDQRVDVEGVAIGSNCAVTGSVRFAESNLLQSVWDNAFRSQRSNFVSIPTDCPQRDERAGWLGDIQLFMDAAAFNMDVDAFIRRFLKEIRATQHPDGSIGAMAPLPAGTQAGVSCGWSEACVILPWTLYQRYGDTRAIDENWHMMERWMYYIQSVNPDGLWRHRRGWDLCDWLSVDAKEPSDETTPKLLCATAYWAYTAAMMADMARATGRPDCGDRYESLHNGISRAFVREFVRADGSVGNGSQTGYVLALHFRLVPEALRTLAAARLAGDVERRGMRLSTGILGTAYLLDALADNGHESTAIGLLLQTEYPSWGYMVGRGATSVWERWDSDTQSDRESEAGHMNSYNHYMFGTVAGFMYRRLAGIAPGVAGFERITARPLFDHRIGSVEAHYDAVVGRISTKTAGDSIGLLAFDLRIPPNTTAEVFLPPGTWYEEQSGRALDQMSNDDVAITVGSGCHRFRNRRASIAGNHDVRKAVSPD